MRLHVLELMITTSYDIDQIDRVNVEKIEKALNRYVFQAKHTSHSVSLFVVTKETSRELVDRISPTLGTITAISDWWVNSVGRDCAARHGSKSPIVDRLKDAWWAVDSRAKFTNAQDLRSPDARDVYAKHGIKEFDRKAAVKMGLGGSRQGDSPPDSNKPDGKATHDAISLRRAKAREQAEALFSDKPVNRPQTGK